MKRYFSFASYWVCLFWVCQVSLFSHSVSGQNVESNDLPTTLAEVQRAINLRMDSIALIEDQLKSRHDQLIDLEQHFEVLTAQMNQVEGTLSEVNVSAQAFPEVLAMLQTMRIQLKVDLAGLQARQKLLQEASPDHSAKVNVKQKKLEVAERILILAHQRWERARQLHESGTVSSSEVDSIQVEVQTAELRLLELKAELEDSLSGSVVGIRANSLELAEKEARLLEVEKLLTLTTKVRPEIQQAEIHRQMLNEIITAREDLRGQISRLELEKNTATLQLQKLQSKREELSK